MKLIINIKNFFLIFSLIISTQNIFSSNSKNENCPLRYHDRIAACVYCQNLIKAEGRYYQPKNDSNSTYIVNCCCTATCCFCEILTICLQPSSKK